MLSRGESLLRAFVKRCFPSYRKVFNCRETGIINPDTGFPLELDIYLPDIGLAFEFHGRQHRTDEEQRERDKHKRKQCKTLEITLIEIWTDTLTQDLYDIIKKQIKPSVKIVKPKADFLREFKHEAVEYKKNIYKMNKKIKSNTFVKRRTK
ncbi:hypothetical protein [Cetobacterium sp.]|uniref:hypothetical protein n=1 Tax=Cetobacterium sp. TaxID=2071632 RepID=UPI003F3B655D